MSRCLPKRESGAWRGLRIRALGVPCEKSTKELRSSRKRGEAKALVCFGSLEKKGMDGPWCSQLHQKLPRAHGNMDSHFQAASRDPRHHAWSLRQISSKVQGSEVVGRGSLRQGHRLEGGCWKEEPIPLLGPYTVVLATSFFCLCHRVSHRRQFIWAYGSRGICDCHDK